MLVGVGSYDLAQLEPPLIQFLNGYSYEPIYSFVAVREDREDIEFYYVYFDSWNICHILFTYGNAHVKAKNHFWSKLPVNLS